MTRGRVAGALGVGAAAACCCLAALSGGRATAVGALGIAPDARGTPPPEYAFVRKARRAFGAALMRASYHQTASDGGAATAEEADALADAEAMADIEDKDFTRGGDYLSSSSSMATAGAGARRRGARETRTRQASGAGVDGRFADRRRGRRRDDGARESSSCVSSARAPRATHPG